MSQWTHVAGVIRFDDLRTVVMGASEPSIEWTLFDVPYGSEGPMDHVTTCGTTGWEGEDPYAYFVTLTCYGDLRDFGVPDVDAIRKWLDQAVAVPAGVLVRQGVFMAQVEDGPTYVWRLDQSGTHAWWVEEVVT